MVSVRGQQISWHALHSRGEFQFEDPEVAMYWMTILHKEYGLAALSASADTFGEPNLSPSRVLVI